MSDYLPEDILINILSRLPVKTLLQFRCVSKTWHSLISSPAFLALHLKQATIRNSDLLFFQRHSDEACKNRYYLYPDKDFPKCEGQELDFPLETQKFDPNQPRRYSETHLMGSSNGLFFIYHIYFDDHKSKYVCRTALWNPSIRKTLPVPRPTDTIESHLYFDNYFGFGFDSFNNDYKLVRVGYLHCKPSNRYAKRPPLVEVYSMKSGCWRMVDIDLKCFIKKYSSSAFVNGACHWAAKTEEWGGETNVIVYFNLADEKIGEMIVPDGVICKHYLSLTVTVFDGLLSMVILSPKYVGAPNASIWAMKKYGDSKSWTKIFNMEHLKGSFISGFVGFKKNGEMFIVSGQVLSSYTKTKNGGCRFWGTKIMSSVNEKFYLHTYMESLVLLNEESSSLSDSASISEANGESKKKKKNGKNKTDSDDEANDFRGKHHSCGV